VNRTLYGSDDKYLAQSNNFSSGGWATCPKTCGRLTRAASRLTGTSITKTYDGQWDIVAMLGAEDAADESVSPQWYYAVA
jgi:hypothetical protein